ncbi:hypothetical protein [Methylobacterium cerastii]|nr:hypothetical protein [Methylobacterium cerastii]
MRYALAALAFVGSVTVASATMEPLKDGPAQVSGETCRTWAGQQSDDAIYQWGMMESGGSSRDLAVARLTVTCLGDPKPAIVGFGSSAGFDRAYCQRHPRTVVCARLR